MIFNFDNITDLLLVVIGVMGLAIVVVMLGKAFKGNVNLVGRIVVCVLAALFVAGLFIGAVWKALSGDLTSTFVG